MYPMLSFEMVTKIFKKELFSPMQIALHKISFSVDRGHTLGLIGANGAGKSTAIKLLMDFVRPSSGTIKINGKSPANFLLRRKIGYLPETVHFPPNLNILNLINFTVAACSVPKKKAKQRAEQWLRELDLWQVRKKSLCTYSKGMQQRASFVLALINDPELLILDEPMSGLDPMGRDKIIKLILRLREKGKTILFCSHILDDVDRLVDNVLVLHKGEKLFYGMPDELARLEEKKSMAEAFVTLINRKDGNV